MKRQIGETLKKSKNLSNLILSMLFPKGDDDSFPESPNAGLSWMKTTAFTS